MSDQTDNETFSPRCFGCGKDNPRGLQLGPLVHVENDEVVIRTRVAEEFAGFVDVVHGGVVAAILDEAMSHHIMRVQGTRHVMTANLHIDFLAPVPTRVEITVRAWSRRHGRKFECEAEIRDLNGRTLARARSLWIEAGDRAISYS